MSEKNSLVSVRISEELKDQAAAVLAEFGLTVSDATRILLTKIVSDGGLPPFLVTSPEQHDAWFRAKVREAMEDTRPGIPHAQAMAEIRGRLSNNGS
jgi:DNA-damage-inducible protein J